MLLVVLVVTSCMEEFAIAIFENSVIPKNNYRNVSKKTRNIAVDFRVRKYHDI